MMADRLSDELRRFILAIPSIPYLEAMLLLRSMPSQVWDVKMVARRLYSTEAHTSTLLQALHAAGICASVENKPQCFRYHPATPELDSLLEQLACFYSHNLIEVTNIIHAASNRNQRVQQFADAFLWRKEK